MTRKRFIKLLMSHGETLYSARTIAFLYHSRNMSYKNAYSDYLLKTSIKRAINMLLCAFSSLGDFVKEVANSFAKFANTLRSMSDD